MDFKINMRYNRIACMIIFAIIGWTSENAIAQSANCVVETVFSVNIQPKPTAAFGFLASGLSASFSNSSVNGITYSWDFGDPGSGSSNTSSEANPIHQFTTPGNYTVTLTAMNGCGSRSITQTVQVACPSLVASIAANGPTQICPGTSIQLTATPGFEGYQWMLGGNPIANGNAANFTASVAGQYTVAVTDAAGCTGTSQGILVELLPLAQPSFSTTLNALNAVFANTSNNSTTYSWNFGDPNAGTLNTSSETNPTHNFSAPGTYTVTLTASNSCGQQSITQTVQVACPSLVASIAANGPTQICPGTSVQLAATQGFQGYQWLLGGNAVANGDAANFTASVAGQYTVVVADAAGCTGTSQGISVELLPLAQPSFSTTLSALNAVFANTSTNATTYSWDFGDPNAGASNTSSEATPTHNFSAPGTYTVTLTASNSCGQQSFTQIVQPGCPLFAVTAAANGPTQICPGTSVQLTATPGFEGYQWQLGGNPIANGNAANFTASVPGQYTVAVTDAAGCIGTSQGVLVELLPLALPSFSTTVNAMSAAFVNTSTNATTYSWDFGDSNSGASNTSSEANPTHNFSAPGTYLVTLTATNACGTQTTSQEVVIACTPPQVSIASNGPVQFCEGGSAMLQAASDNLTAYQWYLNDLPIPSGTSPTFAATAAGQYKVLVTDFLGCENYSDVVLVEVYPLPTATIESAAGAAVCEGTSLVLTGSLGIDYQWVVPDGTTVSGENVAIPTASISNNGTYQLTVTDGNGCTSTAEFDLTVNPLPLVSISGLASDYKESDPPVSLSGTPAGGIFSGNGLVGDLFDPNAAGVGQHTIYYAYTDANNCTNMDSVVVHVSPASATSLASVIGDIRVFPNPNHGDFSLEIMLSSSRTLNFGLVNALGQTLATRQEWLPAGQSTLHFSSNEMSSGVYCLKVMDGEQHACLRVIVAK
jgi:PKD repeat protein